MEPLMSSLSSLPLLFLFSLPSLSLSLSPSPPQLPASFGDINLLVVTDAHSWITGHSHLDSAVPLDAGYGEIASAAQHIKALAAKEGRDVFFVNSGDHTEGSGLSDASMYTTGIHGYDLFPLVQMMPFDALTVGNHDLYDDSTIGYMTGASGFVDSWKGAYLTSNTVNAATGKVVGDRYVILEGPNSGIKILVFGFLYHMTDSCPAVVVQDPADSVQEEWFLDALADGVASSVSAIVVLSHMDLKDPCVGVLNGAIREALPKMPVQFVTGHTHYRGFSKVDDLSSSFEAGHYLDTLGFISFDLPEAAEEQASSPITFNYQYVDANMEALYNFTSTDEDSFGTELGKEISSAIDATVESLGLKEVLGCPNEEYKYSSKLGAEDSLYSLYMDTVLPSAVNDIPTGTGNAPFHLSSTGTLRYDIYVGEFFYDDVFAVAPFANVFVFFAGLDGGDIEQILGALRADSSGYGNDYNNRNPLAGGSRDDGGLPSFVGGPHKPVPGQVYDLFFNAFDAGLVVSGISKAIGISEDEVQAGTVPWRSDMSSEDFVDTTTCWSKSVAKLWPCGGEVAEEKRLLK